MLRECHRVLRRHGRLAGYVIHTPNGLAPADQRRANELGPSATAAVGSPEDLARSVGFSIIRMEDVTTLFRSTCEAILRARCALEGALRSAEGSDAFEEEQQQKRRMLKGIDEGLLLRSLVVAAKA